MIRYISLLLLLLPLSFVYSLEIETSSSITNLYFDTSRTLDIEGKTFRGSDLFWCLDFAAKEEFQEGFNVSGGILTDIIMKRRIFSEINLNLGNFGLFCTPFIGFVNTWQKWINPGFEAAIQYSFPGYGFIKAGFSTTFSPLTKVGDYYTGSQFANFGLYLDNGIVTLEIENKVFTLKQDDSMNSTNELTKYYLNSEIFIKNFPFKFNIGTGYQMLNRTYNTVSETQTTLHSLLIGFGTKWEISKNLTAFINGQSAIATLGWNSIIYSVPDTGLLYFIKIGASYKF